MAGADEFDQVRSDPDPIRRGRRATELITLYQQRGQELARLRREAVEAAYRNGLSYTEIGDLIGVTKGRITQLRNTAPPPERAFFGVGPVSVVVPHRFGSGDGRDRYYVDADDGATRTRLESTLTRLSFQYSEYRIVAETDTVHPGDTIVVCGPKTAPVARHLLATDPLLAFEKIESTWYLIDKQSGDRYSSPYSRDPERRTDIGYLSRRVEDDRVIVHVAGVTSAGSHGVAHWLDDNVHSLYQRGSTFTAAVIECDFTSESVITSSRLLAGPFTMDA